MKTLAAFALVALCVPSHASEPNTLTPAELADGWVLLFDGETTFGWTANSGANWEIKDGVLSVSEGEPGLLNTTTPFGDFELKVDYKSAPGTNSGIFLRTSEKPDDPAVDCYELNIADDGTNPFPTGSLVGRIKADSPEKNDNRDWQTFRVVAQGGHIQVWLDGRQVVDYTDEKPLGRGLIGLQLNSGKVEFRNIKLRPLGLTSIFNGKDLTGWKTDRKEESRFSVTPAGALRVQNGRGQIESEGRYGDFVLQLEVFVGGKDLNSGIFFRSIPGDFWMGYESQICNAMIDGDPARPKDCGTGGIFRRQNARRIVAKDFEWFPKTIIAAGDHISVWVNGIGVSDWTDDRPPHENPRNGRRLEPGTLIIQGHDPTTDLSFRNIGVAEIPKRE